MPVHFKIFSGVDEIDKDLWNRMARSASPMMEWEYFYSLEKSRSVGPERGYQPCHIAVYDGSRPVALAPLYERDRAWVEFGDGGLLEFLSEVTGHPYHRGLVGAIPFTPVPGYQFLHDPDLDPMTSSKILLNYIDFLCETQGLPTSRLYFIAPAALHLQKLLQQQGYIGLKTNYCIWRNRDYESFEDFLKAFKTGRRTKIRRELRVIRENGIDISMVPGPEAPSSYYDEIYQLYVNTWRKHMGFGIRPFLNHAFFRLLSETFRHRNAFSVARRSGDIVGMALFYRKDNDLYGRYWGCFEEVPFLHFATCYYHPVDYAIRNGIQMMDPGFGGEHKLFRGFEVVPSYHYIKFHGEQERRLANTVLERMWSHLGILDNEKSGEHNT
jgi:predicted N-acyltransferase